MQKLEWERRGEYCQEATTKDGVFRIEGIPGSYSHRALFESENDSMTVSLHVGSLGECIAACENCDPPFINGELATAELIHPLPTISRRDYFAGLAMQGMLAAGSNFAFCDVVAHADALIAALDGVATTKEVGK